MFTGTTVGRVTKDLEVQYSYKKEPYIRFNLAVNKGYGQNEHTIYLQCWIFGKEPVDRIVKSKVGRGSLIQITGDIDLVEFEKKGKPGEKGCTLKIIVLAWEYAPCITKAKPPDEQVMVSATEPAEAMESLEDFDVVEE